MVNSSPVAATVNVNDAGVVSVTGSSIGTLTLGTATSGTGKSN